MSVRPILTAACLAAAVLAAPAAAATLVVGNTQGRSCYEAAKRLERGGAAGSADFAVCTDALENEALSIRNRSATFVNRGILHMSRGDYAPAYRDYSEAVRLRPNLGEAQINMGAALIGLSRMQEGIAAIDRGLQLGSKEPEKAYFNRALALERAGDFTGAYRDFQRALELRPQWELPMKELARYQVRRRGDG
ncbi:MAG TPA: tetratricopeptide repeat protein [Caulobacteraceae bacterium]